MPEMQGALGVLTASALPESKGPGEPTLSAHGPGHRLVWKRSFFDRA